MSKATHKTALLLERAARSIERGDLHARAPQPLAEDGADLTRLCHSFNRMAEAVGKRDQERLHSIAVAAHDLRTPLMIIGGSAHVLKRGDMSATESAEWLDRIIRNTVALECITADLIDGVQAEAGHFKLNLEELDLTALARDGMNDFGTSVRSHPLRFEGEGACIIMGDRERLRRMLLNLLSNAVRYSKPGREVRVLVWQRGADACLTVEDQGAGVGSGEVERMFRPFVRLESTQQMAGGSGLGLLSVKRIVEAHGGEINVQGQPQQGTTFGVRFKLLADRSLAEPSLAEPSLAEPSLAEPSLAQYSMHEEVPSRAMMAPPTALAAGGRG